MPAGGMPGGSLTILELPPEVEQFQLFVVEAELR